MKISIVGSGVVGKATGIGFQTYGNDVIFCDIDEEKLSSLKREGYTVTRNPVEAIIKSDVSFICVPTPAANGQMDFSFLENALKSVARALCRKKKYHLVVIRSTVLPSTTRVKLVPLIEKNSRLKVGKAFGVCVNPEFLREVNALDDFLNARRILVGEFDKNSGDVLEQLYSSFKAPVIRTDLDTAEMVKVVSNAFLATKISFFNEIYKLCKELRLDSHFISEIVAMDNRIGTYGIYGGRPFGGKCLPKDLEAFINFIESKKMNPKILTATRYVNKEIARSCNGENE
jgi:UDPglucose 6-dehydrogenase